MNTNCDKIGTTTSCTVGTKDCLCGTVELKKDDICAHYETPETSLRACKHDMVDSAPCDCGGVIAEDDDNCVVIGDDVTLNKLCVNYKPVLEGESCQCGTRSPNTCNVKG